MKLKIFICKTIGKVTFCTKVSAACAVALLFTLNVNRVNAQLELYSNGASTSASGPTVSSQTATLAQSTGTGTFATYTPAITVTISLSNQQYTSSTYPGIVIGGQEGGSNTTDAAYTIYNPLNAFGTPSASYFTAAPNVTTGTNFSTTANYFFDVMTDVYYLFSNNSSLSGTYYYGNITYTFSQAVENPIIHFSGLGGGFQNGTGNVQGFYTELYLSAADITAGHTLTKLSGSTNFTLDATNTEILDNSTDKSATYTNYGSDAIDAGAGSVVVNTGGVAVTSVTFGVYVRGNGGVGSNPQWGNTAFGRTEDGWLTAASVALYTISGTVYDDANGLTNSAVDGAVTNASGKLYANLVNSSNVVVASAQVSSSGTYSFNEPMGSSNTYTVVLTTSATSTTPTLPTGWVNTGQQLSGGTATNTTPGQIRVTLNSANIANANFGIDQTPTANAVNSTDQQNPTAGTQVTVPTLNGTDPEQGTFSGTDLLDTVIINTLPSNGTLYYNGVAIPAGDTIKNYNPGLLTLAPNTGVTSVTFTYSEVDAALASSSPATVTMPFTVGANALCTGSFYGVATNHLYQINSLTATSVGTQTDFGAVLPFNSNNLAKACDNNLYSVTDTAGVATRQVYEYNPSTNTGAYISATLPAGIGSLATSHNYIISGGTDANCNIYFNSAYADYMVEVTPATSAVTTLWSTVPPTAAPGPSNYTFGSYAVDFTIGPNGEMYFVDVWYHYLWVIPNPASPKVYYLGTIAGALIKGTALSDISFYNGTMYVSTNVSAPGLYSVNQTTLASTVVTSSGSDLYADVAGCSGFNTLAYSISGNVYDDANGLSDNTVNGTAYAGSTALNAILYNNTAGSVAEVVALTAGAYNFEGISGNSYTVYISTASPTVGSTAVPAVTLPTGWVSTGENLGSGTGSDGTPNGILSIGTLSSNVTNANFGIDQQPTGTAETAASQLNPGAGVAASVPLTTASATNTYQATDAEDGTYTNNLTGKTVILNAATGGTLYYNGTAVTSATTIASFNPSLVSMAPTAAGTVNTTFTYQVYDNASVASAAVTVTVPFSAATKTISGAIWNDPNDDAVKEGGESFTNAGGLYAVLTNSSGVVIQSVVVNAATGAYSFGVTTNGTYKVVLSTASQSAGTTLTSSSLPANWVNTGVNTFGVANTANRTGILSVNYTGTNVINQNFGILQCPNGLAITAGASQSTVCASASPATTVTLTSTPSGGITPYVSYVWGGSGIGATNTQNTTATPTATTTYSVTVTDALGCTASANATVTYDQATPSIALTCGTNSNGINYAQLSENSGIATSWLWTTTGGGSFYPDNTLSPNNNTSTSTSQVTYINYNGTYAVAITDGNGCSGSGSTILNSGSCNVILAASNLNFTVAKQENTTVLGWSTTSETNNSYFEIERSGDGTTWQVIGTVQGQGSSTTPTKYSFTDVLPLAGGNYYRLKQVDVNGLYSYSPVKYLVFTGQWLVKLYPNPVQNYLVMEFNNDKNEKANIVIQSVLGNTVFAMQQQLATGLNRITLNGVQQLAAGTYVMVMSTTENTFRSKFVKGGN